MPLFSVDPDVSHVIIAVILVSDLDQLRSTVYLVCLRRLIDVRVRMILKAKVVVRVRAGYDDRSSIPKKCYLLLFMTDLMVPCKYRSHIGSTKYPLLICVGIGHFLPGS